MLLAFATLAVLTAAMAGCQWLGPGGSQSTGPPSSTVTAGAVTWSFPTAAPAPTGRARSSATPDVAAVTPAAGSPLPTLRPLPPPPTAAPSDAGPAAAEEPPASPRATPVAERPAAGVPPARPDSPPAVPFAQGLLPSPGYQPPDLALDRELERRVRERLGDDVGDYGIMVKRLSDGRGVAINPDRVFYAASLFKLEVLYSVFKQRALGMLDFGELLTITPFEASYDLETLPWEVGSQVSVADLLEAMVTFSDNTSAIVLYDRVGWARVDSDMRELGLQDSSVLTEDLPTSARDMFVLMDAIASGEAVDRESSAEMIDLLSRQRINNRLPAMLPPETLVAHKTGEWDNATHDVGIVYAPSGPYVVALLSDKPWDISTEAELSALVYEYFESVR
ncbi:MAG: serine hydrolase [Chloroflexi bacterium]|nr:serine hydrolase [Chloroflexota bacterium]